ncbi:MAG TPA: hypothetical protein VEX88_01745 [Glaciibacter sp.]|nr:hypothetical protein [Glaciibacter sp.]
MINPLGTLLTGRDLPVAELCCARLDGELVAVGEGWSPVDLPVGEAVRAQAAALLVPPRVIAERMTAAWIFGLVPEPTRHHFCVDARTRAHVPPSSRIQLREVNCTTDDTLTLGGLQVTTPLRTVSDLARHGAVEEPMLVHVIAALLAYGRLDPQDAIERLSLRPRAPHTGLALRRVHTAASVGLSPGSVVRSA